MRQSLAHGVTGGVGGGDRRTAGPFDSVAVEEGDLICLVVGSRNGDRTCDATAIDLAITPSAGPAESTGWDLARDCAADLATANPHADSHGRPEVWHFGSEPDSLGDDTVIPGNSTLARILTAPTGPILGRILEAVARPAESDAEASATGSPFPGALAFGRTVAGIPATAVGPDDLCLRPPHGLTVDIPRELAAGAEIVATAVVPAGAGPQASVQPWVSLGAASPTEFSASTRILATESSPAWERFTRSLDAFRELIPKAVCYGRVVPVDEVVTLNLFYREDDRLRRLMLDDVECARLDRLWDELLFIAQEPLELEDAFDQMLSYTTQNRADMIAVLTLMQPVIAARVEDFRKRSEAARRLAEEFGTQWLHVHGFSSLDEKNADLFPTFADLRADMEEETVLFLDDFFRNDRSILALVDADHTFLNERLARHYGVEGVTGEAWRRVEGVRKHGRGSILCLATTLSTQAGDSSVLDAVLETAADLRRRISRADRRKLDQYFDSVRDVEARIEAAAAKGELQGWRPTLEKPDIPRPADGIPQDIAEHMRLMCDILVLAFQTDTTRIVTLKLNNDHSALRFPNLERVEQPGQRIDYMIHHLLSHSDGADWLEVNRFFTEQLAHVARRLDAIQEGERTALDNSMVLYCSSMMAGAKHDNDQLPMVVLGRAGGRLETGRVLDYSGKTERQMCRLYLSLMEKMGVREERFGDATAPLDDV